MFDRAWLPLDLVAAGLPAESILGLSLDHREAVINVAEHLVVGP